MIVLAVAAGVPLVAQPPAEAAAVTSCWVTNTTKGIVYGKGTGALVQRAIKAAAPENRLKIQGRCVGNYTVNKNLTLVGAARTGYPVARLDGNYAGAVLTVTGSVTRLDITNLTITHGRGVNAAGIDLAGTNLLTLTLHGSTTVTANTGPGISSNGRNYLKFFGTSSVTKNTGGGIVATDAHVIMGESASLAYNTADRGGGIANYDGELVMTGQASIKFNSAKYGGGFFSDSELGYLYMSDSSTIANNSAVYGGGVYTECGLEISMTGSSTVTRNTASISGGGMWGTGVDTPEKVHGNTPDDILPGEC